MVVGDLREDVGFGATVIGMISVMGNAIIAFRPIAKRWAGFITAIGVIAGTGITKDCVCKSMQRSDLPVHREKAGVAGIPDSAVCSWEAQTGRIAMHVNI